MAANLFIGFSTIIARLHLNYHFELFYDIIRRTELEVAKISALTEPFNKLRAAFSHEEKAYKRHKLIESDEMKDLDKWRLGLVSTLSGNINVRLKSVDAEERKAARLLKTEILQAYKKIYKLPAEEKTAAITNMINDFQKTKYQSAVVKLQLNGTINELISANHDYNQKFDVKTDEDRLLKETGSPTDARPATNDAFKALLKWIEALHDVNLLTTKDADLHETIMKIVFTINGLLDEAKKSYAHRKKKKNKDESAASIDVDNVQKDAATDATDCIMDKKDESTDTDDNNNE
ncbi:MAG: DUF6261 family protein [Tannerellaceae bacterium]|jgi:hypothetical protein|nr:DUF6261 family protein [Tannerellaceae bacterium]